MTDNKLHQGVNFIYKIILLNFTYFFSMIIGLWVVGFFPATYALFKSIVLIKETTLPNLIRIFLINYKQFFIKTNIVGYLFLLIVLGAYINYQLLYISSIFIFNVLSILFLIFVVYLFIVIINSFILFNYHESKINLKNVIVQSGIYTYVNIGNTFFELVIMGVYFVILSQFPVFFLFGGTSLLVFFLNKVFISGVNKINQQNINYLI